MQRRYWLGFALVLLILVGSFCLPRILLRWEQGQVEKRVVTVTEEAQLSPSSLSLAEKHRILSDDSFVILQETELSAEESVRVKESAMQELELLWRSGAVDDFSYRAVVERGQQLRVRLCVAITDAAVFRFYDISEEEGILRLDLDADTEKILRLALMEAWETGATMQTLWETTKGEGSYEPWEEMQAWAQYYGLKLEDVRLWNEDGTTFRQEALLLDENGKRTVFCKLYNSENGGMGWQAVPEMDFSEDSIQSGIKEDTNIG